MRGLEWLEDFDLFFFIFFIHTFLIFLNKLVLVFEKLLDFFTISSKVLADFSEDSLLPTTDGNDCDLLQSSFKIKTCNRRGTVGSQQGEWVLIEPFLHIC